MDPIVLSLLSLGILIALLSLGVPIALCFGGALCFMSVAGDVSMKGMLMWGVQQILSPTLLCIPLFIYAGSLMSDSGIAKYLLEFVDVFVGRVRGGLGMVATISCALIGAISGSAFSGVAATGNMLIPEMVNRGYPRPFATALVTASSILGVLIPPSTPMIIFGWVTGTSVLACFLATVVPGLITTIIFCCINRFYASRFPLIMPPPMDKREKRRQFITRGWKALPAIAMPIIILGGIYTGVMTPTEAAAVAVAYSIPVGFFIYRGLTLKSWYRVSIGSAVSVGTIMIMILCSMMLSQTYVMLQIPQVIVETVFNITDNRYLILILLNFLLLFVGMIVNDTTGIILCAPLLLPLATAIGLDPVHYAAIFGVNLAIGSLTPPYASLLYLGMRIGKVEFSEILPPVMIFLAGYSLVMLLTTYWSPVALFLPRLLGY
ncbi:MAG: TRAP transporter large permease [Desulfovibrio sp.]|jgi:tripartite ATP-independent transporter DctM subunit|nr:TRAP transporter large permease [Desulfovibrio sp.]